MMRRLLILLFFLAAVLVVAATAFQDCGVPSSCCSRCSTTTDNTVLLSSKSSTDTLQQQIIQGATLKLIKKDVASKSPKTPMQQQKQQEQQHEDEAIHKPNDGQFTYYIREAHRSEMNQIADVLMASFHSRSRQPTFDSYIRRYKQNHLQMCFDAIEESDRGIFVACASSSSSLEQLSSSSNIEDDILVGFCLVDGRAPDPSCKIEFLTPSTLASTSPRPYLSDLGVIPSHRRQGIGELLVQTCERWADKRGYETLYLKVEEKNTAGVRLYYKMGYKRTKLPWGREINKVENRFDTTLLMEKSLVISNKRKRKREWIKQLKWW